MTSRDTPANPTGGAPQNKAASAADDLRTRGEAALRKKRDGVPPELATLTPEAAGALLHDLQVHQIELELQNDELRNAQLQIEAARERYADLYEFAPVGYCTLSEEGRILDSNLCAAGMLGLPRAQLLGKPFSRFVLPDDAATFQLARKTMQQEGKYPPTELRMQNAAGEWFWVLLAASAAPATNGYDTPVTRLTISDISAQKNAAAQLLKTQRGQIIGSLAAGFMHNFNNILATILGNTHLAIEDSQSNQNALISLHEIEKSATRARTLVEAIGWFAHQQPERKQRLAIGPLVERALQVMRATLPARVVLLAHPAAVLPEVLADPLQIQQAIINVVTNAMQAARGGTVRIELRQDTVMLDEALGATDPQLAAMYRRHPGMSVRISIVDDGPGMDMATLSRVFEPFFTTRPPSQGAGLGLPVAQGIMETHEGAITVQSKPGRGTTVTLYLPPAAA